MKRAWASVALCLLISGCQFSDLSSFFKKQETVPSEVKVEMNQVSLAKAHSELLSEMMKVVFHQEKVDNKSEFGGLTHSLNQGASLEGVYHGIVMGSRYRGLEGGSKAASPAVLKAFVYEMVELQSTMKSPTEFEIEESKKAPNIEFPDGSESQPRVGSKKESQEVKKKKEKSAAINELLQIFIGASNYTLKRVLAAEALKKFDELKDSPAELAQWYAQFVLRFCDLNVDFGLELRNKPDFDFHFKFAQNMAPDRVKWEVVNRYHRYLNHAVDHEN